MTALAEKHPECKFEAGSDDCFSTELDICNDCMWWEEEMVSMVDDWSGDWEEE